MAVREALVRELFTALVGDVVAEVVLEQHRGVCTGTLCVNCRSVELFSRSGLDVFGGALADSPVEFFACPSCGNRIASSRFAPHLEKCAGKGGRQAARTRIHPPYRDTQAVTEDAEAPPSAPSFAMPVMRISTGGNPYLTSSMSSISTPFAGAVPARAQYSSASAGASSESSDEPFQHTSLGDYSPPSRPASSTNKRRRRDGQEVFWDAVAQHRKKDRAELIKHFETFCSTISLKNGKMCANVLGRCVVHSDEDRALAREKVLQPLTDSDIIAPPPLAYDFQ